MLTVLSNRFGDVALLMVLAWMIDFGSWSFFLLFGILWGFIEIEYNSFLFVLATVIGGAQIPISSWLPAAMAAHTSVHSSTLVTAGVYF